MLRYDFLPRLACTGAFTVSKLRNLSEVNMLLRLDLSLGGEKSVGTTVTEFGEEMVYVITVAISTSC